MTLSSVIGSSTFDPPAEVITTYCLPSAPRYVEGVAWADARSLKLQSSAPVFASNARMRESSVAPIKTRPPAVAIDPPRFGLPVFCLPFGKESVTPSGICHAILPVLTLIATSRPQGGCWHKSLVSGSQKRPDT